MRAFKESVDRKKKEVFSPKRKETPGAAEKKGEELLETEKKLEENKESMEAPSKIIASPNGNKIRFMKNVNIYLLISENEEKVKRIAFEQQSKEPAISNVIFINSLYIINIFFDYLERNKRRT